ncbi:MAG: hypothetical protein UZ05_CHB002002922 [Chlorobi bacterium OLB5]|nr:MAG: hypothetical protein UZ05_CHB002002922 [Chlorobi bacterium OLB5]
MDYMLNITNQHLKKKKFIINISLFVLLFVGLCSCQGMPWYLAIEQLEDKENEVKSIKQKLIDKERENNYFLKTNKDITAKINKCSNDIAETKFCLDKNYDKKSDSSLIFFKKADYETPKDTSYYSCCTDYRKRFKLKEDEYETWQKIIDEISYDINNLNNRFNALTIQNDSLNNQINEKRIILNNCEINLYKLVDSDIDKTNEFRKRFEDTEKIITAKELTKNDRIKLLSELEETKIVCLPEFRERFKSMKKREGQ